MTPYKFRHRGLTKTVSLEQRRFLYLPAPIPDLLFPLRLFFFVLYVSLLCFGFFVVNLKLRRNSGTIKLTDRDREM